jgi:dolichol-phosphate mannosyltransferase
LKRRAKRHVFVVLPAYNEEGHIGRLLDQIDLMLSEEGLAYHIVVVDDGSVDGTRSMVARRAERMPLTLRVHERNQGLGATIRDGIVEALALASSTDIIVTMDADETQTPGLILRMTRMIKEGYDVVIASRYQPNSRTIGVPFHRRLLSLGASALFRILFPTKGVRDFTCGYRAYRADVLRRAVDQYGGSLFDRDGFECMVDILLKLRHMGLIFGETPFILRYDHKGGESKMDVGRTIRGTLRLMIRRRVVGDECGT